MKLSKETVALIKNFAAINTNILLKPGNVLSTISAQKNIMASVTVAETFPVEFGIYDLNEFLGTMSLFEDPDLSFFEKYINMKEGSTTAKLIGSEPSNLVVPSKPIVFPDADVDFSLADKTLSTIQRTASVMKAQDVSVVGDGSKLSIIIGDKKVDSSNSFEIDLGNTGKTFKVHFKVDNFKMIPGDYDVSISSKKISRFKNMKTDLVYYVAIEADSTFE